MNDNDNNDILHEAGAGHPIYNNGALISTGGHSQLHSAEEGQAIMCHAYHEAGHIVLHHRLKLGRPLDVNLDADEDYHVSIRTHYADWMTDQTFALTPPPEGAEWAIRQIVALYAGSCAEALVTKWPDYTRSRFDYVMICELASHLWAQDLLSSGASATELAQSPRWYEIGENLNAIHDRAKGYVTQDTISAEIEQVAQLLIRHRRLSGEEVTSLLG